MSIHSAYSIQKLKSLVKNFIEQRSINDYEDLKHFLKIREYNQD